jgi:hypothetical protein
VLQKPAPFSNHSVKRTVLAYLFRINVLTLLVMMNPPIATVANDESINFRHLKKSEAIVLTDIPMEQEMVIYLTYSSMIMARFNFKISR